jgi:hypothetical protein
LSHGVAGHRSHDSERRWTVISATRLLSRSAVPARRGPGR